MYGYTYLKKATTIVFRVSVVLLAVESGTMNVNTFLEIPVENEDVSCAAVGYIH